MTPLTRRAGPAVVLALALLTAACSSGTKLYPVTGKVLVKGQPAAGAQVIFFPEGVSGAAQAPSTGTCGPDGTFTLSTGAGVGAPAGTYVVTVTWPDPSVKVTDQQKMMGMGGDAPDVLNGTYGKDNSPLRATVPAGPTTLDPYDLK